MPKIIADFISKVNILPHELPRYVEFTGRIVRFVGIKYYDLQWLCSFDINTKLFTT